ncbi:MAG: hypothetical protein ACRD2J_17165 [Thermoanaerobaculia bacterium]
MTDPGWFRSELPPGRSGAWVVEKVVVRDREYDPASDPRPDCFRFRPGTYTVLRRDGTEFMTDRYDEWWTQRRAIAEARGRGGEILITGLGIGLVAEAILREPASRVGRITIVESSPDVIRLVAPWLSSRYPGRIEIVEGDAFAWTPAPWRRFTVGWHDIWPDPRVESNRAEIERLRVHHAPWCAWQGFWPEEYLLAEEQGA